MFGSILCSSVCIFILKLSDSIRPNTCNFSTIRHQSNAYHLSFISHFVSLAADDIFKQNSIIQLKRTKLSVILFTNRIFHLESFEHFIANFYNSIILCWEKKYSLAGIWSSCIFNWLCASMKINSFKIGSFTADSLFLRETDVYEL